MIEYYKRFNLVYDYQRSNNYDFHNNFMITFKRILKILFHLEFFYLFITHGLLTLVLETKLY